MTFHAKREVTSLRTLRSLARNPALSSVSAPNRAMEQSATWRSTFAGACAMIRA
jgi:hypothetical protein